MWHGPFKVAEICGECMVRLEIVGKHYRLFTVVHVPKLKRVGAFPYRPTNTFGLTKTDRVYLDDVIQLEDSFNNLNCQGLSM